MISERKIEKQDDDQTTGKHGATTSIQDGDSGTDSGGQGNGQQGAGGLGGIGERTTPNQAGSQPHLGSAGSHGGSKPGTGLTENSDPTSRKGVPDAAGRGTWDPDHTAPDIDAEKTDGP